MKPTIGRIVWYYPSKNEAVYFNNYQDKCPAIITSVWSDNCVNLKILHDGPFDRWKTYVIKLDSNNDMNVWDWPERVE